MYRVLITGGAGFIGAAAIKHLLSDQNVQAVVNLDALTYAANPITFDEERYTFVKGNVCDRVLLKELFKAHNFTHVLHFAAETHVDRSIASAMPFVESNIIGTVQLLETVRLFPEVAFHHVSTDEVYGSLGDDGIFTEKTQYAPNSPYSASKAASDHFVRAYAKTYGIHCTISHCSNNFGLLQNDEKLIPTVIRSLVNRKPIPLYGDGTNIRDWLHVDDHVEAVWEIARRAPAGETYNIGGGQELKNIDLVRAIIALYKEKTGYDGTSLISFVEDRKGHDYRYALSFEKLRKELGWVPKREFLEELKRVVHGYADKYTKKVVCVIPARLGSSRFPEKILHKIGGKPLIQITYEAAKKTGLFDDVLIALDDEKTKACVETFTDRYLMTKKEHQSGTARLTEVAETVDADIFVNWQCDEPLIKKEMIETLLQGIHKERAIWTLRKKCKEEDLANPHRVKVTFDESDRAIDFKREAISKWKHIGIYAYSKNILQKLPSLPPSKRAAVESLEQLQFLEHGIPLYAYETDSEVQGVDLLEDALIVSKLLAQ